MDKIIFILLGIFMFNKIINVNSHNDRDNNKESVLLKRISNGVFTKIDHSENVSNIKRNKRDAFETYQKEYWQILTGNYGNDSKASVFGEKSHGFFNFTSPCNTTTTFCEQVPDYPTYLVNKIAIEEIPNIKLLQQKEKEEIMIRIGGNDEESLCKSESKIIAPKAALTQDNQWKYIYNDPKFVQTTRVDICRHEKEPCNYINDLFGLKTMCKQQYIYRKFVTLTSDGKVTSDMFRIPSSCCCSIKINYNNYDYESDQWRK
ncbi:protein spaetzle [Microplitis demolitor]|uniref:protein spaetzle n=1 Tax=Microplitis demolitor TaxID=69319 RepID=UPI0004CCA4B8|nr:protein spaetzle [Microplitis demolitor]